MNPVIGLTAAYNTSEEKFFLSTPYVQSVESSGGTPLIVPYTATENIPKILDLLDGLVLTGGGDINPLLLGVDPVKEIGEVSTFRDRFELELTRQAILRKIPIFGICRGLQILCVAGGGKLIQDLYSYDKNFICHSQKAPRNEETHLIALKEGSFISKYTDDKKIPVNSFHHQAIKSCGKNFLVSATASDGVIEAIESKDGIFTGVQWHPETLYKTNLTQQKLFTSFIEKAKRRKANEN